MNEERFQWWNNLLHGGLLLDAQRLRDLIPEDPQPLDGYQEDRFRRRITSFQDDPDANRGQFAAFVLEAICGLARPLGEWSRGAEVSKTWSRRAITGESIRPRHLWTSPQGAVVPVFIDDEKRLGIGRGKRVLSHALQWLRQGDEQLAIVTNGYQWRLLFAGLDYDAFCEWDIAQWFTEGCESDECRGMRALLAPRLWTPAVKGEPCPLVAAINESRKGQSDLSQILGERVRQAVELLVRAHAQVLNARQGEIVPQDIYRAGVRMIMRMVVVLFAESREGLLPRDNPVYHNAYSLGGLRDQLERTSRHRRRGSFAAWPRILSLFRLIHEGCSHEALPVPRYGGELFAPGDTASDDGLSRAMAVLEKACFDQDVVNDDEVREILDLLTRTKVKIRQGRVNMLLPAPVDFSRLDSEYIGILYEGLLDFELRTAPIDNPIIFLAVGNQPALPLATLEGMDDRAIKNLLEKFKDTSSAADEEDESEGGESGEEETDESVEAAEADSDEEAVEDEDIEGEEPEVAEGEGQDYRQTTRSRAEAWARRACIVGGLVTKPRGKLTPERKMQHESALDRKARQIVTRVVLPGEWYLVRWGGTRKGSGTFYTRPQLAVPTVHRTLRPLAYDPPLKDGQPDVDAPLEKWTPKKPEEILKLKVCDPACGSGSFLLASLRFLSQALHVSLRHHGRIREHGGRAVLDLIAGREGEPALASEALPCRPEDEDFEPRTRAVLRRYVVERCIYGVDIDPLAVELCRLSLWIETLDRRLPFTFLEHKVKPGNSLVGAWFDQFLHYPAMAWEREGGDKSHTQGVHYKKEQWTKAIKARRKQVKNDLIKFIDGARLVYTVDLANVATVHDEAEKALQAIHTLGIHQAEERAARYHAMRQSEPFRRLKDAFDLWCALWFWPADRIGAAPLPTEMAEGKLSAAAREIVEQLAARHRFFHWELEFPDVFNAASHGFDAVLGNPPWDISKPNSKEFFSAYDPLYRSYGKQEAIGKQAAMFGADAAVEHRWLEYCAYFKAMTNWVKYAGFPFGDRESANSQGKKEHDFGLGSGGAGSFAQSKRRHDRWRQKREESSGYADAEHSFRHQGSADVNLYKLFLEQAESLLREGGRLGLIVPSGLYSDHGTGALRRLFLDRCRWQWLFGFENREGIFDIHRSFKFNPVIVEKGGQTAAIRTAFMRRNLADWEQAERLATEYPRERVVQFSPKSLAVLEIQSARDLEVLTKIYSHSVLLGDQGPDGWGIRYATEFHMTNDSKLFPPRPKWEEWGYRPDEYSRWIKGPWKPVETLYAELGVKPLPEGRTRCAQPPYHKLPLPRADLPPGVILSREATHYLREDEIPVVTFTDASGKPLKVKTKGEKQDSQISGPAIALPLYEGRMIGQYDFSEKRWTSGKGRGAVWEGIPWDDKRLDPQFLMGSGAFPQFNFSTVVKIGQMRVTSGTNTRTLITTSLPHLPCGDKVATLRPREVAHTLSLVLLLNAFAGDYLARQRIAALQIDQHILYALAVPPASIAASAAVSSLALSLAHPSHSFSATWLRLSPLQDGMRPWRIYWALTPHERLRLRVTADAIAAAVYGLDVDTLAFLLRDTDLPLADLSEWHVRSSLFSKGFWRVDKDKPPEHRHTVLTLVAFHDLQEKIAAAGGDVEKGIEAFCAQNDGEGWMLPETLRLADYGLGHDGRAKVHQPVRECFGPRFYEWQLAQSPEESWRECHLHARNLLGPEGYQALLDEIAGKSPPPSPPRPAPAAKKNDARQGRLFETHDLPLFPTE